jgi:hypothetical protein
MPREAIKSKLAIKHLGHIPFFHSPEFLSDSMFRCVTERQRMHPPAGRYLLSPRHAWSLSFPTSPKRRLKFSDHFFTGFREVNARKQPTCRLRSPKGGVNTYGQQACRMVEIIRKIDCSRSDGNPPFYDSGQEMHYNTTRSMVHSNLYIYTGLSLVCRRRAGRLRGTACWGAGSEIKRRFRGSSQVVAYGAQGSVGE